MAATPQNLCSTTTELCPILRNMALSDGHIVYRMAPELLIPMADYIPFIEYAVKKTMIDAVCAITYDQTALEIARWVKMTPNGRASKFLDYYLSGSGREMKVNILSLLEEDDGISSALKLTIRKGLHENPAIGSGRVPLPQRVFTNQDWQYATGSIVMDWSLNPVCVAGKISVTLSFRNTYRWHPKEPRITQCLHQAAENLKVHGAKDFEMIGGPTVWEFSKSAGSGGSW